MPSHNAKYTLIAPGHYRTFKVEYDDRATKGRSRAFKTEAEARLFIDALSPEATYRLLQVDQITKGQQ